jgi:predicted nucleic acid-binding Zn ribbon protein
MPLWDFLCPCCGRVLCDMSSPTMVCPICSRKHRDVQMERLPAAGSFVLKGAGFYANDYGPRGKTE